MFFATHLNRKKMEDLEQVVQKQNELIALYKETTGDRDQIIDHLKKLVNLQEDQIDDLKRDLKATRLRMESCLDSVQHLKEKLSEYEKEQ